ncbi:hypothetical protein GTA08_BOTSDO04721 [Botryosphaeria dothidea]|uniref:Uncharacterized protein n=1 Tax=Botryosphaeria dothidea TaxID=55169 RepID=A0A8H4IXF1_9PEZI|nr:hypothetical protein GTA08_BOTSDO04721 [Botryosphaeria dothidea]
MTFKRKRSDSTSSPASTSSNFSRSSVSPSPPSQFFASAMQLEVPTQAFPSPAHSWVWQPSSEAGNDSGRTMKRFRDNRPDERLIYESTLRRLYNAQREQPHASPIPSQDTAAAASASHEPVVQKSTLHKFWNISQPPSQPPAAALPSVTNNNEGARCQDCDTNLVSDDSMNMDVDGCGLLAY